MTVVGHSVVSVADQPVVSSLSLSVLTVVLLCSEWRCQCWRLLALIVSWWNLELLPVKLEARSVGNTHLLRPRYQC